jgi:hypothetical protein
MSAQPSTSLIVVLCGRGAETILSAVTPCPLRCQSRRSASQLRWSDLPQRTDILKSRPHVSNGPTADVREIRT